MAASIKYFSFLTSLYLSMYQSYIFAAPNEFDMIITEKHRDTEIIFLVEESDEGGYLARSVTHSIYTEADTLDDLRDMVRDAVMCHFGDDDIPSLIRLHIVKDVVIAV